MCSVFRIFVRCELLLQGSSFYLKYFSHSASFNASLCNASFCSCLEMRTWGMAPMCLLCQVGQRNQSFFDSSLPAMWTQGPYTTGRMRSRRAAHRTNRKRRRTRSCCCPVILRQMEQWKHHRQILVGKDLQWLRWAFSRPGSDIPRSDPF